MRRTTFARLSASASGDQTTWATGITLRRPKLVPANSARQDFRTGEQKVVDARRPLLLAVHDHARQHGRERRAALDQARSRPPGLRARMDRECLRARLRSADAERRQ